MRVNPQTANVEPMRAKLLSAKEDPKVAKRSMERCDPMRTQLLSDIELPKLVLSITASENRDPSLDKPSTATEEPIRAMPRRDTDAPIVA
jgi:hypothetical protein